MIWIWTVQVLTYKNLAKNSDKFYHMYRQGAVTVTNYGRVGTTGTWSETDHSSIDAAIAAEAFTVREKVRKGYSHQEVTLPNSRYLSYSVLSSALQVATESRPTLWSTGQGNGLSSRLRKNAILLNPAETKAMRGVIEELSGRWESYGVEIEMPLRWDTTSMLARTNRWYGVYYAQDHGSAGLSPYWAGSLTTADIEKSPPKKGGFYNPTLEALLVCPLK